MSYRGAYGTETFEPWGEPAPHREPARRVPEAIGDLKAFFGILHRYRWFILGVTAGAIALAGAYILRATPAYMATVSVLIDARPRLPVGADPQANPVTVPDATLVESQVKLIASDVVLRRVVEQEKLIDDPEYVPNGPGLRTRLLTMLGLRHGAPGEDRITRAIATLSQSITVKRSERTYVIEVDLASGDPEKAARLANLVAEAYIADQRAARLSVARDETKWLTQRLYDLQSKLQEAENKAQEFRAKNRITDAVGKNMREQEFSDLTNEVGRARARLIDARTRYELVQRLANSGRAPDATAEALKSPVLEKLRVQYADIARQEAHYRTTLGARHPAMLEIQNQLRDARQNINAELKRVAETAANDFQLARSAEAETIKRAEAARASTDSKNVDMVQLRDLDREVEAHRGAYERFLRARENGVDENRDPPNARIIAPASPPLAPSSPKSLAILFIAASSGLSMSIGAALLHDFLRSGAKVAPLRREYSDERDDNGGGASLEVLAEIPRIGEVRARMSWMQRLKPGGKSADATGQALLAMWEVERNPDSPFSQAIGELHDALLGKRSRNASGRRPLKILISPVRARSGATTIAVNFARLAAASGLRVLLIEANSRRPSLAALVGDASRVDLIDLDGAMRPIHALGNTHGYQLAIVPIVTNEAGLAHKLARNPQTKRIRGIGGNFDLVIIDGPSLEDCDSARLLADAVDQIVIVSAPGDTPPGIDRLADALDVPDEKLSGAVLSMVETRRAA